MNFEKVGAAEDAPQIPPIVLSVSAFDPTGAGGVQGDLATFAAMGCYGLSVATCNLIADTRNVDRFMAMDSNWLDDQIRYLLEDMAVDAIKIGAVGSVENITTLAEILSDYPSMTMVLDPKIVSGHGDDDEHDELLYAMREMLLPQATLTVVNTLELARLLGDEAEMAGDPMPAATMARQLVEAGSEFVLVSGTHLREPSIVNVLYGGSGQVRRDHWDRLPGSFLGAGTTLAAAITAMIASGVALPEAVAEAQDFTWRALQAGFRLGMGRTVPDRVFWAREGFEEDDDATSEADSSDG